MGKSKANHPAAVLLERIDKGELDPAILSPVQRRLCVRQLFYDQSLSKAEIAARLGRDEKTIYRDVQKLAQENEDLVTGFEARRVLADLMIRADLYERKEAAAGNWSAAWKIREGMAKMLQTLGFLPQDIGTLTLKNQPEEPADEIDWSQLGEAQQVAVQMLQIQIVDIIKNPESYQGNLDPEYLKHLAACIRKEAGERGPLALAAVNG
jgi:transposase